jgi:ABC-type transporter MlaC component
MIRSTASIENVVRIGVSYDADGKEVVDVASEMRNRLRAQRVGDWELGYLTLTLYKRAPWRDGVNGIPEWSDFIGHLENEQKIPVHDDDRKIRDVMDVYAGWSKYNDAVIVDTIKDIGISKPHIALAYLKGASPEQAREIIKLCETHTARTLRTAIRKFLGKDVTGSSDISPDDRAARQVLAYLADSDNPMVKGLFVPRRDDQGVHVEFSWRSVFTVYAQEHGLSTDQAFAHVMHAFVKSLPSKMVDAAYDRWTASMEATGAVYKLDPDQDFIFGEMMSGRRRKAAA